MEHLGDLSRFRRECIDVDKVFDYVIVSLPGSEEVTIPQSDPDLTILPTPTTPVDFCNAIDPTSGNKIKNVRTELLVDQSTCSEVEPESRPDEVVEVNGETVVLQWVTIEKDSVAFRFSFDVVDPNGCVVFTVCGTSALEDIEPETLLLCAPNGTTISCELLPSSVLKSFGFTCDANNALTFTVKYNLCQAIQSFDEVKLEVIARLCQPRPIITPEETCEPVKPKQCPRIFPGPRNME